MAGDARRQEAAVRRLLSTHCNGCPVEAVRERPPDALVVEGRSPRVEAEVGHAEERKAALDRVGRVGQVERVRRQEKIQLSGSPDVDRLFRKAEADRNLGDVPLCPDPERIAGKKKPFLVELGKDERTVPDKGSRFTPRLADRLDTVTGPRERGRLGEEIGNVRPRLSETELAGKLVRHDGKVKLSVDTIRIACANVESELAGLLAPRLAKPREAKKTLANLFAAPGRIRVKLRTISIELAPASTHKEQLAFNAMLEEINRRKLTLPGDALRRKLRFRSQIL